MSATTTIKAKAFLFGEWSGATASATLTKGTYYGGLYPDTPKSHAAHRLDGLFKVLCGRRGATRDHEKHLVAVMWGASPFLTRAF